MKILTTTSDLAQNRRLVIYGAGETGRQLRELLEESRPDLQLLGYFDSFREDESVDVLKYGSSKASELAYDTLLIASVFWQAILDNLTPEDKSKAAVLSNKLLFRLNRLDELDGYSLSAEEADDLRSKCRELYQDKESLAICADHLAIRAGHETPERFASMARRARSMERQYLDFDTPTPIRSIVEGGSFDAASTEKLASSFPELQQIVAFDPIADPGASSGNVRFERMALGAGSGTMEFALSEQSTTRAGAGRGATVTIPVVSVDEYCRDNNVEPDLIKLDVEGSELEVLRGARDIIEARQPVIACSAYHRSADLVQLAEILRGVVPEYTFHLRAYSGTLIDTVLYAQVPEVR